MGICGLNMLIILWLLRGNVWENQRGKKISRYNVYFKFAWWNYLLYIHEYTQKKKGTEIVPLGALFDST